MTAAACPGTVAGAVDTRDADTILRACATAKSGALELTPEQAHALFEAGAIQHAGAVTADARVLLAWLAGAVESIYGIAVPAAARHVYLCGRLSGRRGRDPGMLALLDAGWRRVEDGSWRAPHEVALLGTVALARGFGAEVRAILALRQLTTTWLAAELGISRQRLGRVLATDVTMPVEQYLAICEALNLDPATHAKLGPHTTAIHCTEGRTPP